MCYSGKLVMKREALVKASKVARSLKSLEEIDGTINYVLLNYIYETGDANEFKTFDEWKIDGYGVRKGEKAFIAWGKPRERVTKGGKELKYFPVIHLFSDKQVYRIKTGNVMESSITRGDRVGEFKVFYVRDKDIKYKHINSPGQMAEVFTRVWDQNEIEYRESVYVLALNNNCDVLGYSKLFEGGITSTVVDERMIFQFLLGMNATAFVIAHNHPSGKLHPSNEDIKLTRNIKKCADIMRMAFVDHLIITRDKECYYSFSDNGQI